MRPTQAVPTESTRAGAFAAMLARAFGPAIQAAQTTPTGALFLAFGDGLAAVYSTVTRAIDQAFITTATDLLSDLEAEYNLSVNPTLSTAQRQSRLTAKVRAARAGTPQGITRAFSALDATVIVRETTTAVAHNYGAAREVYYFTVQVLDASFDDATVKATMVQIIDQMKPAHTLGELLTGLFLTTDDATLGRLDRNGAG